MSPSGITRPFEIDDFAQENRVVSAFVFETRRTPEARGTAFEAGRAFGPVAAIETAELVRAPAGEAVGEFLLVGGQDMYGPGPGGAEHRQVAAAEREAPQDHRRVERDGIEAVGGQPGRLALGIIGGHDGDAGHEGAERIAEGGLIDHGWSE